MGFFKDLAEKKQAKKEEKIRISQARDQALSEIRAGNDLPVLEAPIILQKNEVCHYANSAIRLIGKIKTTGYAGGYSGVSVHVAKGVTLHTGATRGHAVKQNVVDRYAGDLFITSKRIIFQASKNGFSLPLNKLVSLKAYTDGCELFKDGASSSYVLTMKEPDYLIAIISGTLSNMNK